MDAELLCDGQSVGSFAPFNGSISSPAAGVAFGAGSSLGTGSGHFHRVKLALLRPLASTTFRSPASDNSTGGPATIQATGSRLAADNDLALYARELPPNQFGFFVNGTSAGFTPNPGGSSGNLCLGGTLGRYFGQIQSSGPLGEMAITLDLTQTPSGANLIPITAGQEMFFQCWFRDSNPGATSNFTDGTRVAFE